MACPPSLACRSRRPSQAHRRPWRRWGLLAACALASGGCGPRYPQRSSGDRQIGVAEILDRCVATYTAARTVEARGALDDRRRKTPRSRPIRFVMQRPDRFRIEIGGDLVVLRGRSVQTYSAALDRLATYRAFTNTPARTAAELASDGIVFLTLDLLERGSAALDGADSAYRDWRFDRLDFAGGRPCFVLSRRTLPRPAGRTSVWIDQDQYAVRRWTVSAAADDGPLVAVELAEVRLNAPVDGAAFALDESAPPGGPP